jgi:lipoprotein-releasing system permease protein
MKPELYIASKYFFYGKKNGFIKIISFLSTAGIAIGVAALIVVISVFNGFGNYVQKMLINADPHIMINFKNSNVADDVYQFIKSNNIITFSTKFIDQKSIIYKNGKYYIVNLKGYDNIGNISYKNFIVSGKINLNRNEISIGVPLAIRLETLPGDTIIISSFKEIGNAAIFSLVPKTNKYIVANIFETHNRDYDLLYAYTNYETIAELVDSDTPKGYEIWLKDISKSDDIKNLLLQKFPDDIVVFTWFDLHKELYKMMQFEKWAAFFILTLIIFVATFNILASLTMTVLKKKKDIAILKTYGLTNNQAKRIFYLQGIFNGIIGTSVGLILGLFICYIQINYKIYPLDPNKFLIDAMPIQIDIIMVILICITSIFLSFIASIYPAKIAYQNNIIDAIKWE